MGLAKNVYRRQAVYWWRRRFADPSTGRSRMIAINLRVRRPDAARRIGDALNARAYAVAKRLELRLSSVESARQELADICITRRGCRGDGWAAVEGGCAVGIVFGMLVALRRGVACTS